MEDFAMAMSLVQPLREQLAAMVKKVHDSGLRIEELELALVSSKRDTMVVETERDLLLSVRNGIFCSSSRKLYSRCTYYFTNVE